MKCEIIIYPQNKPKIPIIPAIVGGAGSGSLKKLKTPPTIAPTVNARII